MNDAFNIYKFQFTQHDGNKVSVPWRLPHMRELTKYFTTVDNPDDLAEWLCVKEPQAPQEGISSEMPDPDKKEVWSDQFTPLSLFEFAKEVNKKMAPFLEAWTQYKTELRRQFEPLTKLGTTPSQTSPSLPGKASTPSAG